MVCASSVPLFLVAPLRDGITSYPLAGPDPLVRAGPVSLASRTPRPPQRYVQSPIAMGKGRGDAPASICSNFSAVEASTQDNSSYAKAIDNLSLYRRGLA